MGEARQDQVGPQIFYAPEAPCPTGAQPSGGHLLEQQPCYPERVSPLLVLAAHLRGLVQHTLESHSGTATAVTCYRQQPFLSRLLSCFVHLLYLPHVKQTRKNIGL